MSVKQTAEAVPTAVSSSASELLRPLMEGHAARPRSNADAGLRIGQLLALLPETAVCLVSIADSLTADAKRARAIIELDGRHIGRDVLLGFENNDPERPIILGLLTGQSGWPMENPSGHVEVAADGHRIVITANRELVLRCGKSSISLRYDGRIEVRGEEVLTQAAGANRIRGGSVELN